MTATVSYLADRRWWPSAQDAWAGGWRAVAPDGLDPALHDEWRAAMRRLARRLGVTVRTDRSTDGRPVAVANAGYPLGITTVEQRDAWDMRRVEER